MSRLKEGQTHQHCDICKKRVGVAFLYLIHLDKTGQLLPEGKEKLLCMSCAKKEAA